MIFLFPFAFLVLFLLSSFSIIFPFFVLWYCIDFIELSWFTCSVSYSTFILQLWTWIHFFFFFAFLFFNVVFSAAYCPSRDKLHSADYASRKLNVLHHTHLYNKHLCYTSGSLTLTVQVISDCVESSSKKHCKCNLFVIDPAYV